MSGVCSSVQRVGSRVGETAAEKEAVAGQSQGMSGLEVATHVDVPRASVARSEMEKRESWRAITPTHTLVARVLGLFKSSSATVSCQCVIRRARSTGTAGEEQHHFLFTFWRCY